MGAVHAARAECFRTLGDPTRVRLLELIAVRTIIRANLVEASALRERLSHEAHPISGGRRW